MLTFEWDARKVRDNEAKHGVSFEHATQVFDDPRLVLAEDAAHSRFEARYLAFGYVEGVRGERIRIIGAGYWRKGRVFYEQANRLP